MTGSEYCHRCQQQQPVLVYRPFWGVLFKCQVCGIKWRKKKAVAAYDPRD